MIILVISPRPGNAELLEFQWLVPEACQIILIIS